MSTLHVEQFRRDETWCGEQLAVSDLRFMGIDALARMRTQHPPFPHEPCKKCLAAIRVALGLKKGAELNRHGSEQVVGTPWELIHAVESKFGPIALDLAATHANKKAPFFIGADEDGGSLHPDCDWERLLKSCGMHPEYAGHDVCAWLNPEYADILPWAKKCAVESVARGARILMLVPASVGAAWFTDYVQPFAQVYALCPRVKFEGHKQTFPKDLILCAFGFGPPKFETWRWKPKRQKKEKQGRKAA